MNLHASPNRTAGTLRTPSDCDSTNETQPGGQQQVADCHVINRMDELVRDSLGGAKAAFPRSRHLPSRDRDEGSEVITRLDLSCGGLFRVPPKMFYEHRFWIHRGFVLYR